MFQQKYIFCSFCAIVFSELPELFGNPASTGSQNSTNDADQEILRLQKLKIRFRPLLRDLMGLEHTLTDKTLKTTTEINTVSSKDFLSEHEKDKYFRQKCDSDCKDGECIKVNDEYQCKLQIDPNQSDIPKVCGPGFECDHGVCDMEALQRNSYACICERNYVGQFCNRKCPIDCGSHGHCDLLLLDNTFKCFCRWNYTGPNCSEPVPLDPGPISTRPFIEKDKYFRQKCDSDCKDGECIKVNDEYQCKLQIDSNQSDIPKVCGPGFECDHGVCDMEALQGDSYACICERNYFGYFCNRKCPIDCGSHGHCDLLLLDNTFKCFCRWNYTGPNCSEPLQLDPVLA